MSFIEELTAAANALARQPRPDTMVISPEVWAEIRKMLLRGTLAEWWSVVREDIEQRTGREMFLHSRR